jgi:hypothetical protein
VKRVLGFLYGAAILTIGCDPALTIHQVEPSEAVSATQKVTIQVKTMHQLIGETWYAPQVKVTNSTGASITVTQVELTTGKATYENKPSRTGSYPFPISPGETQVLDVWFHLNDSVRNTFHTPTHLRVHYRSGDKDMIADSTIVGARLDTSAP